MAERIVKEHVQYDPEELKEMEVERLEQDSNLRLRVNGVGMALRVVQIQMQRPNRMLNRKRILAGLEALGKRVEATRQAVAEELKVAE